MIKVDRDQARFPSSLSSSRALAARQAIEQVLRLDGPARAQRRVPFDAGIYAAEDVRGSLQEVFQGRCAFCESSLRSMEWAVHHFRPLRAASDGLGQIMEDHYAWLAYEWRNLYAACNDCNRVRRSSFPVRGARAASFSTLDEARGSEAALLLDPDCDDPKSDLRFRWNGICEPMTDRGEATVAAYHLNRPYLLDDRQKFAARLLDFLKFAPKASAGDDFLSELDTFGQGRPGAFDSLLRRFVADLTDRTARRPSTRNPVVALRGFLKDFDADAFQACVRDAQDEASVTPNPTEDFHVSKFIAVATAAVSRREAPLPARDSQLRSIAIDGFKAIRSVAFALPERRESTYGAPCLMLLGENATGKSSILEALALALTGTKAASKLTGSPSAYLRRKDSRRWALVDAETMQITVDFFGGGGPVEFRVDPARQEFEGVEAPTALVLAYGPRRYFAKDGKVRRGGAERRVRTLFDPMATIPHPAPWLNGLEGRQFEAVARALREVLALHTDDDLVRDGELGISVRANGFLTPLERMSEGYKSLFAMTVDMIRELLLHWRNLEDARAVVLIDEVETHLHPRWKMRVMQALRRALPNVTFVATTHDPLCLRGLDDGEVSVLVRDKLQEIETLRDLPSIKGLRAEQLLTSDFFGLSSTSDPETEAKLSRYAGLLSLPERQRSADDEAQLREVEAQLSRTLVVGDTAAEQVVAQAMREFLDARRGAPVAERSAARRRAVAAVLDAFNKPPRS